MDKLEQHRMLVANAILKDQMRKNIIKINGHNIYVEPWEDISQNWNTIVMFYFYFYNS